MAEQATVAGTSTRGRLSYLDGVRALAALYVVLHHVWFTAFPAYPRNIGPTGTGWLVYGHLAVAVFIVVSGFSLTIAPARRGYQLGGVKRFLRRRAWRILPPYWAAIALSVFVFGVLTPDLTGRAISLKGVLVHALLLQDVIDTPKPNGAFWSIAVEWQIYFLFPLVLLARRRLGSVPTVALAAAAVLAAQFIAWNVPALDGLLNLTPQFFALFVLGVAAAGVVNHDIPRRVLAYAGPVGIAIFAGFVVLAAVQGPVWIDSKYFWIDLAVGAGTACLLAALADNRLTALRSLLAGRVLSGVGAYSYSVYLVHLPFLWLVGHYVVGRFDLGSTAAFLLLMALGVPVVLAGSYGFHRVFELPFMENRSLAELTGRERKGSGGGRHRAADVRQHQPAAPTPPVAASS
jgi:peptidoglycan/LPS O-acetylase OafA/YrhL